MLETEGRENYLLTIAFAKTVKGGEVGLSQVPEVLKDMIKKRVWENIYSVPTGETVSFNSIMEWIEAYPPEGLDTKPGVIEALIKDDDELFNEFTKLLATSSPAKAKSGAPTGNQNASKQENNPVNNRIESPKAYGSSNREYLTRVMARDCPDVLDEIGKGKKYKSVRAAALAQGIIKPRINVSWVKDEEPAVIAGKLVEVMSRDELRELYDQIGECFGWG